MAGINPILQNIRSLLAMSQPPMAGGGVVQTEIDLSALSGGMPLGCPCCLKNPSGLSKEEIAAAQAANMQQAG